MASPAYPADPADNTTGPVRSGGPRFAIIPASLARDPRRELRGAKLVLLALASYADAARECWPSVASLSEDTGLDRSTVQRALRAAEEAGYLHRELRAEDGVTTTLYTLLWPEGGRTSAARGAAPARPGGAAPARPEQDQWEQDQGTGVVASPQRAPATAGALEAEALCEAMAESVHRRLEGRRRPRVTDAWRSAARLLVDRDGAKPQEVLAMIEWVERDEFWRANVLSMPKLRERWDTLTLQRQRGRGNGQGLAARNAAAVRAELGL